MFGVRAGGLAVACAPVRLRAGRFVLRGSRRQAVLADRARAGQGEPDRGDRGQNDPGGLSLVLLGAGHGRLCAEVGEP